MKAPFPYNAKAGVANDPAEQHAEGMVLNYIWLARWSDEMNADADLDHKKFSQFVYHCDRFRSFADRLNLFKNPRQQDVDAVEGAYVRRGMRWASDADMLATLQAVYDASAEFQDWAKAKMQHTRQAETFTFDENFGNARGQPVKSAKSAEAAERVRKFRELFA